MTPTTRDLYFGECEDMTVYVLGLHVWAALRPHSSVQSERFGQQGESLVDGHLSHAAMEGW